MAERNAGLPLERQMWFRIGINLGDVMISGGDLFGDGVNVAARLQALADPGGILVSGQVHDLVQDKLAVGFGYLGDKTVKNIAKEVPVYRVLLAADGMPAPQQAAALLATSAKERGLPHDLIATGGRAALIIAVLFGINLFAGGGTWWFQWPTLAVLAIFGLRMLSVVYCPRKRDQAKPSAPAMMVDGPFQNEARHEPGHPPVLQHTVAPLLSGAPCSALPCPPLRCGRHYQDGTGPPDL
jgi:hypothetical protein